MQNFLAQSVTIKEMIKEARMRGGFLGEYGRGMLELIAHCVRTEESTSIEDIMRAVEARSKITARTFQVTMRMDRLYLVDIEANSTEDAERKAKALHFTAVGEGRLKSFKTSFVGVEGER